MAESAISLYEDDNLAGVLRCISILWTVWRWFLSTSLDFFDTKLLYTPNSRYPTPLSLTDSVCLRNNRSLLYLDMYARCQVYFLQLSSVALKSVSEENF